MSATSRVVQPEWVRPATLKKDASAAVPVLKLYNTLTRNKEEFVPVSGSKTVTWYSCGPTVYDAAHMGHARNYVSIDINRRIMQNYFGYDVKFVQNVTDIDDKIILRARQTYLFDQYMLKNCAAESVADDVLSKCTDALWKYTQANLPNYSGLQEVAELRNYLQALDIENLKAELPKLPMHVKSVKLALEALEHDRNSPADFLHKMKDVLVPVLDSELGYTLNDPEIFRKLPAYWEKQFDKEMSALNVLQPDVTTRVSEYVPEIIDFVQGIIDHGYAYSTSDGSVYFDTAKFDGADNHDYAKCQPWNKGQLELINDAEGSLSNLTGSNGKKSPNDFALWKASKAGEPEWVSPWGKGRPGWHIECSVMASDILGSNIDIHSGGIDLAFPHHDNELAQSEARFDNKQWINYFLHTGHLHIEGQKMSKSLKNFITIDTALKLYTPRQLRLAFAFVQWNNQLDFKEALINEIKSFETSMSNFFSNVRALNNDYKLSLNDDDVIISKKLTHLEKDLLAIFQELQEKVHQQFCDNLSTPQVLKTLGELVSATNTYITQAGSGLKMEPILSICKYVTRILDIIGFPKREDHLGWENAETGASANNTQSLEDSVMPYVKCLSKFRDEVRILAKEKAEFSAYLKLTDRVRDQDLFNLNISLDDRNGQSSLVKFLTESEKNEIAKQNEEKLQREQEKMKKKKAQQELEQAKDKERKEKAKIPPSEMFKNSELYSEWDSNGLPTKDKDGNEITKSMTKKLKKQWDQQKKLHDEYIA